MEKKKSKITMRKVHNLASNSYDGKQGGATIDSTLIYQVKEKTQTCPSAEMTR